MERSYLHGLFALSMIFADLGNMVFHAVLNLNDQKDTCLVFSEILVRIYLNLTKNIYEISTKKYNHLYCLQFFNDECFSLVYRLMCKFLFYTNPDIYFYIYLHFVPDKD